MAEGVPSEKFCVHHRRMRFPPAMVEVTSDHNRTKLKAQVPDEQQQRDAHRTSIRASVVDVDVRDCCKVGA